MIVLYIYGITVLFCLTLVTGVGIATAINSKGQVGRVFMGEIVQASTLSFIPMFNMYIAVVWSIRIEKMIKAWRNKR